MYMCEKKSLYNVVYVTFVHHFDTRTLQEKSASTKKEDSKKTPKNNQRK